MSISLLKYTIIVIALLANGATGRTFDETVAPFKSPTTHPPPSQPVTIVPDASDSQQPTLSILSSDTEGHTDKPPTCFYVDRNVCTEPRPFVQNMSTNCAECFAYNIDSMVCCNVTNIENALGCMINGGKDSSRWINLHIRNATLEHLDFSLRYLKNLHSLAITDGNIPHIINRFSPSSKERCLNVSSNNVMTIDSRPFTYLAHLEVLDMSYNNLTTMPPLSSTRNMSLHIRGNNGMLCSTVTATIENKNVNVVDNDYTYCLTNQTYPWFNSSDSVSLWELERLMQLTSECLFIPGHGSCKCEAEQMTFKQTHFRINARVDCSNMGLTELPEKLPLYTVFLNVSNNNLTNLNAFNLAAYDHVIKLVADDNQIQSLLDLEGTTFLNTFHILSLRRNKLKTIPMYLLTNSFEKSVDGRSVYLEGNQLHCDCNTAKVLKMWLLTRNKHITDTDRIQCENSVLRVVELSEMRLCQSPHDWADYIDILIGAEIFLLLALVCKVSYDYWVFKTAGYLPWPASKMPKLPCDWLCES